MKRAEPLLLLVLTGLCLILGVLLLRSRTEVKLERLAALEARRAAATQQKSAQRLQARVSSLEAAQSAASAASRDSAPKNALANSAGAPAAKKSETVDLTPFMKADPEWQAIHEANLLKRVARQYGDLSRLNLPPDQLAKLQRLLADRLDAPEEAREVAAQQGMDPNSPEMWKAAQVAQDDLTREIKTIVPDAAMKDLEQTARMNNSMMSARNQLENGAAADLAAAGMPLSSQQIDALVSAQAQLSMQMGLQRKSADARQDALLTQAAQILSPAQLDAYKQSMDAQKQINGLQTRAMEAAKKQLGDIHSWTWRTP